MLVGTNTKKSKGDIVCYVCAEKGHISTNCKNQQAKGKARGFICNKEGHLKRTCPDRGKIGLMFILDSMVASTCPSTTSIPIVHRVSSSTPNTLLYYY